MEYPWKVYILTCTTLRKVYFGRIILLHRDVYCLNICYVSLCTIHKYITKRLRAKVNYI